MRILNAAEAAKLLRLNVKRVQVMARDGRLPASRIGRKWLFRSEDLEAMLGRRPAPAHSLSISARNRLRGRVSQLTIEGLMAEVVIAIGDQQLVSIITRASAERLGLKPGDEVFAVVKSTEVMIGKQGVDE